LGQVADGTTFTRKFVAGQVLFGKRRAYQRKAAVAEFEGICSGDILVFEPSNSELIPELLPFIVQSDGFFNHALGTSAGSLSPRTKWKDLANYEFALPPRDEQRRIAEVLWAADESVQQHLELRNTTAATRTVVMRQMLTAGVDLGEIEPGSSPEVLLPEKWQWRKLGDLCFLSGGNGFRPPDWSDHGLPIIRIQNLNGSTEFNYFAGEPEPKWVIEPGDLLFAWAGVKGVSFGPCIWPGPRGVLNQHTYKMRLRKDVSQL
jgi:type I restriction enzyme S subunit